MLCILPRVALLVFALLGVAACGDDEPAQPSVDVPSWAKVAPEQLAEAKKHGVPVAFENDLGMRFVLIPAGTFWMIELGPPIVEGARPFRRSERSRREATIAEPFYMQITEVTNAQYRQLVPDHVCAELDGYDLEQANQPVCRVTWNEAAAFAKWAKARLPTEAEWERAARGRLVGKEYPWGDEWNPALVNSSIDGDGHEQAAPVGSFPPNSYGLYDMTGNVGEWCADSWVPREIGKTIPGFTTVLRGDFTEMTPEEREAWEREQAEEAKLPHRVVRGGSWMGPHVDCADRSGLAEIGRKIWLGFRLVSPLPERGT